MGSADYIGRFAPSPTGPLHFGSLVAALASYLDARSHAGRWLVRIEDIDPPREVAGATDDILRTLERAHLHWDGEVLYQSTRLEAYRETVGALIGSGQGYRCRCTRRELAEQGARIYPGLCRNARVAATQAHAIRVMTDNEPVSFDDRVQGRVEQRLQSETGDYVVWRRDQRCAYQLAVTLDDAYQGITHVVRGADLLSSTPRQIHLRRLLDLPVPSFAHIPVAVNAAAQKLSKRTGAEPLTDHDARAMLHLALCFLQQEPPMQLQHSSEEEQLKWAVSHWNMNSLSGIAAIEIDSGMRRVSRTESIVASQPSDK